MLTDGGDEIVIILPITDSAVETYLRRVPCKPKEYTAFPRVIMISATSLNLFIVGGDHLWNQRLTHFK